ncbi:filamentous hemagglutinin N-terminal domain-containing protein [Chromobacterium haemolyticum]|nr:filamentous hemagglutinin N-terminal domain-containing protein [Chromobacterium haemolyticum]
MDGSNIMGQLNANGRVFLVNPNGVLFGKTAQVNVGGLVASTQDLSVERFMAGNYRFEGNSAAEVSNQGTLAAQNGGAVALLGARVSNTGVIQANLGKVALAGGKAFTLDFDGSGLVNLQVDEAAINAEVRNGNLLRADGGEVLMTARASNTLLSNVVNNTGVIEARTLQNRAGKIVLDAGDNQRVNVAGTLNASAQGSFLGDGGQIEVKGKAVTVALATNVTTAASNGRTGTWKVSAEQLDLSPSASTPVSSGLYSDTVSRNLANTNIELVSTQGDLNANGKINWSSGNKLTLRSDRQNVNLNADLNASGAARRGESDRPKAGHAQRQPQPERSRRLAGAQPRRHHRPRPRGRRRQARHPVRQGRRLRIQRQALHRDPGRGPTASRQHQSERPLCAGQRHRRLRARVQLHRRQRRRGVLRRVRRPGQQHHPPEHPERRPGAGLVRQQRRRHRQRQPDQQLRNRLRQLHRPRRNRQPGGPQTRAPSTTPPATPPSTPTAAR